MTLQNIVQRAEQFTFASTLNKVEELGITRIFDPPLVGIACADDEIFQRFTSPDIIGEHHLLPQDMLAGAQSVVSYFLPFSQAVRAPNRAPGLPAVQWLYGRYDGEVFNRALAEHLAACLSESGDAAAVPMLKPDLKVTDLMYTWSERHAAYAAGLGTFGLSRSLVTSKGCAGRYGSIITTAALEPTPRHLDPSLSYCSTCGKCISRCPAEAISTSGMNRPVCAAYLDNTITPMFTPRYGCGKCQTAVPCETTLPKVKNRDT